MNEFSKSIRDAQFLASSALPGTSPDLDLGANSHELLEGELSIPSLTAEELPEGEIVTLTIQGGDSVNPTSSLNIVHVTTGTGSTIAAQTLRFRLPASCPRYVNLAAAGPSIPGKSASIQLLF